MEVYTVKSNRLRVNLIELFQVRIDDIDLVRAQFAAFSKQIPLLYFILTINTMAVVYSFADRAPVWLAVYLPSALCLLCTWRGIWWLRARRLTFSDTEVIRHMRLTNIMAKVLAIAFTTWSLCLYPYGDAFAKAHIAFYMAVTVVGCIFCLVHLRSAAFSVTAIVGVPYVLFFLFVSKGAFGAIAVNFGLVCVAMTAILMTNFRDFAQLVASRRALIVKHAETQVLSDENLRLANVDALSGLPNRRALLARLDQLRVAPGDGDRNVAIVFIDLDGFKDVNDTYGHETGDELIRVLSRAFSGLLPAGDLLGRLGGDEFAAILTGPDAAEAAMTFSAAILERLMAPIAIGDRTIQSGASIGVAAAPEAWSGEELFRRADVAMYYGKTRGKGRISVYDPALDRDREALQAMESEIRDGLARGEFEVYFQPVVDAATRRMVGVEALVRWPRRPGGPLGPDVFIEVAESSGLIHPLGLFVLRRACTALKGFDDVKLSVNISPAQFRDPAFEQKVGQVLTETGFPAGRLELEVTEGYLIDHPVRAQAAIAGLKAMGMSVALDDFGTGYTSIAYLRRYGFNRIKIDKSLAGCIQQDNQEAVLVAGTVFLANGLLMAVTAEGVETEEQAVLLRLAGCQHLQGFLFSPAVDFATLQAKWLQTNLSCAPGRQAG